MLDQDQLVQRLFESGNLLSSQGQRSLAIACYEAVLRAKPEHEWALNNYGYNLFETGDLVAAEIVLSAALEKYPKNPRTLSNLIEVFHRQRRGFDTIPLYRRLMELEPQNAQHRMMLANACLGSGCIPEAIQAYKQALEVQPDHEATLINYLLALNYCDEMTVEEISLAHEMNAQHWDGGSRKRECAVKSREPGRRLKVAYSSNDFGHHPVGKIMAVIIAAHDRSQFEIICYHDGQANDGFTELIKTSANQFYRTTSYDTNSFADLVRSHNVDLFVDLNGYMGGRNRIGAMAQRIAPVQISFLGYPNTTGHPEVDYRITDRFTDPPGPLERLATEKSLRLDSGFLCFEPPTAAPQVPADPAAQNGYVTFGSFNNPSKISPSCLAAWGQILQLVPKSRLLVKYGDGFKSERLRDRWRALLAERGVARDRIVFENSKPTILEHLECMGSVDICLDSFPYQGTMTTLESLTAGVPVVTLKGQNYCRSASSALLLRLGYDELVTVSVASYVKLAQRLAENTTDRLRLRSTIRTRFLNSEICQVAGFVRDLERGYRDAWTSFANASEQSK